MIMMNQALPPEIIQIIFFNLCPPETIFPLYNDTRLLVTRICSRWRAIALRMLDLWANLRIPTNLSPPHDHIRAWISRSAPSTFSVTSYRHSMFYHEKFSAEIFDLILPAIQRCAFLNLRIDEQPIKRLFALPPGSLCALQSISITATCARFSRSFHTLGDAKSASSGAEHRVPGGPILLTHIQWSNPIIVIPLHP